ncbi:MAG: glucose-6-phosphate isomerase [Rhodospirillales bacterium]|nr:glucose-6-phosphate isomerase [Rhodospirillales bacterium]
MTSLRKTSAWKALAAHRVAAVKFNLGQLFRRDKNRVARFSLDAAGLFIDYSKNRIEPQTRDLLVRLAEARDVGAGRDAMLAGQRINVTEDRAVLHVALRAGQGQTASPDRAIRDAIAAELARVRTWAESFGRGQLETDSVQITDILHLGIGGSDLAPRLALEALAPFARPRPRVHFVSNVDGAAMADALRGLDPHTTAIVVVSKSFSTEETLANARIAKAWLVGAMGEEEASRQLVAVTSESGRAMQFGVSGENCFRMLDGVGGRYSLWSTVGLTLAAAIGFQRFQELLDGARAMDEHFMTAPLAENAPVILALLGIWNSDFLGAEAQAVVPYAERLRLLPNYLQQLDMESNGKSVTRDGVAVDYPTAPIVFGTAGTDGQHAYFQLLHQGTRLVPVDFIAVAEAMSDYADHHALLLANCFAQGAALMRGKTQTEVLAELKAAGIPLSKARALAPHKVFSGNRPSTTILLPRLDPRSLGALIALYEHKVFVQGQIWGINSFDQWGVELGKALGRSVRPALDGTAATGLDASTLGLVARVRTKAR